MAATDSQIEHELRRMNSEWITALVQRDTAMLAQKLVEPPDGAIELGHASVDLHAVARGENRRLVQPDLVAQPRKGVGQLLAPKCQALAQFDRRGTMIQSYQDDVHAHSEGCHEGISQLAPINVKSTKLNPRMQSSATRRPRSVERSRTSQSTQ